jgi:hypothetical protein
MMLKIATLGPMPRASARIATAVKPLLFAENPQAIAKGHATNVH